MKIPLPRSRESFWSRRLNEPIPRSSHWEPGHQPVPFSPPHRGLVSMSQQGELSRRLFPRLSCKYIFPSVRFHYHALSLFSRFVVPLFCISRMNIDGIDLGHWHSCRFDSCFRKIKKFILKAIEWLYKISYFPQSEFYIKTRVPLQLERWHAIE